MGMGVSQLFHLFSQLFPPRVGGLPCPALAWGVCLVLLYFVLSCFIDLGGLLFPDEREMGNGSWGEEK